MPTAADSVPGHFSFNLEAGRCPTCQGNGIVTVEMQFLADVELVCEDCKGTRFKNSVLEVRYKSKNIAEVLDLTVHEAMEFFAGKTEPDPQIARPRGDRPGIPAAWPIRHFPFGRRGAENQAGRVHIARSTARQYACLFSTNRRRDCILTIFAKLLAAFDKLIGAGNSLLVIEHNLEVIKTADWVIDLGPEGGDAGGQIVFEGTPEDVARCENSHTGRFLQGYLK